MAVREFEPNVNPQADPARPNAIPDEPLPPQEVNSADLLTRDDLEAQMRWTMYQLAVKAAVAGAPQEAEQFGNAILRISQAVVILDPSLVAPQGVPADALHPPTPQIPMDKQAPSASSASRKLSVVRDAQGRLTGAKVEG
jgi:hypothetical protein